MRASAPKQDILQWNNTQVCPGDNASLINSMLMLSFETWRDVA